MGPLLFIIYLNDFEKCLRFSKASVYTDDTNDVEKFLHEAQQELFNLSEWMRINKLSPNPEKTEYMIIGHSRKLNTLNTSNPLTINGTDIKRVTKTKSLGIVVDENLSWDEQYNTLKGKIYGGRSSLKKLKNIIPKRKLCSVYYAIIERHLRYTNEIWGSLPKTKLDALQRLQDKARTIIENARLKDNWSCDWLSIENIIRFDRSVMAYKIINKLSQENFGINFNKCLRNQSMQQGIVKIYKFPSLTLNMRKRAINTLL